MSLSFAFGTLLEWINHDILPQFSQMRCVIKQFCVLQLSKDLKRCVFMFRMRPAQLKALTFDVTNTLLKARGTIGHQYADAALAHGIKADPAALDSAFDAIWTEKKREMPDYGKHHGVTSREWWSDLVKRVFTYAGHIDASPEKLSKVFDTLWDHYMVRNIFLSNVICYQHHDSLFT